jgi:ANTAR domain
MIYPRHMTQSLQPASTRELTPDAEWPIQRVAFSWAAVGAEPHNTFAGGDRVTPGWDYAGQYAERAQVETAVGVLMDLCGWEATTARSRLVSAAVRANAPITTVAQVILPLGPEHPPR